MSEWCAFAYKVERACVYPNATKWSALCLAPQAPVYSVGLLTLTTTKLTLSFLRVHMQILQYYFEAVEFALVGCERAPKDQTAKRCLPPPWQGTGLAPLAQISGNRDGYRKCMSPSQKITKLWGR